MSEPLFRADAYASRCEARVLGVANGGLVLDRTVFYPTGGGQPGDRGQLIPADAPALEVVETIKGEADAIVHLLGEAAASPAPGTTVTAEIDWPRRHRLMRMHSALHLLCAAVACPVTGGQVGDAKSRLDFDLQGVSLDKDEIALRIGRWIAEDHLVREHWIDAGELEERPELVRTLSVRARAPDGDRERRSAGLRRHARALHRRDRPDPGGQDREQGPPEPAHQPHAGRLTAAVRHA
jgi:misacylated tRNA(Ala) deacylase